MSATDAQRSASRQPLTAGAVAPLVVSGALARVAVVAAAGSTNTELLRLAQREPDEWPHLSALVADHQTAGRGRSGRGWQTPQGAALTVSVVVRPDGVPSSQWGWAPLVVGLATVRALRDVGVGAALKWPNDVVVQHGVKDIPGWGRWRKVVGILCETVPGQDALVAGIGINVSQASDELPVPSAASLATLGAQDIDRVGLLERLAVRLGEALAAWEAGPESPEIREDVAQVCATLGWDIAVDVPDGSPVTGRAVGLADDGGLRVATANGEMVVHAGDVRVRRT